MSFKRMHTFAALAAEASGRSIFFVEIDMLWCFMLYGTGYLEYRKFGFDRIRKHSKRKTFMTMRQSLKFEHMLNDSAYYTYFTDKANFNRLFAAYIGRDWLDLRTASEQVFFDFCRSHRVIFLKPIDSFGGLGISRVEITDDTDLHALYGQAINSKQLLAEEAIKQCDEMNRICPSSVNTIRIVTIITDDTPHFIYAVLRMGNGKGCVDNATSGGVYCLVGDDGVIRKPAFSDKTALYYDKHPYTGVVFDGLAVPMFTQAVEMCLQAALVQPHMRYVGWDAAITADGPILVEANNLPGYDLAQSYGHLTDAEGILPKITALTGIKF